MEEIKTINLSDEIEFDKAVNELLSKGYKISSTYCGFVNSEQFGFCSSYQAILIKTND